MMQTPIKLLESKRESKHVDFKRCFDPKSTGEWCELVKDIVAMANAGGGAILIGVEDNGEPSGADLAEVLAIDPAVITDKVRKFTGVQFDSFTLIRAERSGVPIAALIIGLTEVLLVFEKVGTYQLENGKQRNAFSQGTIYTRHGAKSEPVSSDDIRRFVERRVEALRREWMAGVRKVVNAPAGATISVVPRGVQQSQDPAAMPIRITDNPNAPEYRLVDPNITHPWRQKELIQKVNAALPESATINQFHIKAIRHLYDIDSKPEFIYKGKFSSPQYSESFYEWLLECYSRDTGFFKNASDEMKARTNNPSTAAYG